MKLWLIAVLLATILLAVNSKGIDENLSDEEAWEKFQESKQKDKRLVLQSSKEQAIRQVNSIMIDDLDLIKTLVLFLESNFSWGD
jgi:hypothetical protein